MTPPPRSRARRMRRRLAWGGAFLVVAALVALGDPREFARAHGATLRLSIATGGTGGVWYPYGGGVARVISRWVPNVAATAEVTSATVDNLKFLRAGVVDVAFAQSDALDESYRGVGAFSALGRVPAATLAVLYANYMHVVTFEGSGIASIADLRGKVVSLNTPGSGTEVTAIRMLEAAGLDPATDIRKRSLSLSASADALRDGKIDAFFAGGGAPAAGLLDLAQTPGKTIRLLPGDDVLPALQRRFGDRIYLRLVIPARTYAGQNAEVPMVGVPCMLVVDEGMSETLAYEITRALFEHRDELIAIHPEARHLTPERAVVGSPIPFHPGAIRYFRERGTWPR